MRNEFNLNVLRIGQIENGIDGCDEYFKVEDNNHDELDAKRIDQFFGEHFHRETYQEAGGYFCKTYAFVREYPDDNHGTLIVHHRYDV